MVINGQIIGQLLSSFLTSAIAVVVSEAVAIVEVAVAATTVGVAVATKKELASLI